MFAHIWLQFCYSFTLDPFNISLLLSGSRSSKPVYNLAIISLCLFILTNFFRMPSILTNLDSPVPLQSLVSHFGKVTLPFCSQILNFKLLFQHFLVKVVLVGHGNEYHQNRSILQMALRTLDLTLLIHWVFIKY